MIESAASLVSIKLLRMTKLTRIAKLLDISRFKKIAALLTSHYNRNDKIRAQLAVKNIYKVFRLIVLTIFITYFTGVLYVYFLLSNVQTFDTFLSGDYFIHYYHLEPASVSIWDGDEEIKLSRGKNQESHLLVAVMYFTLTTLSTVGYGDMYPISAVDKIFIMLLQLVGIVFFSYVLGMFVSILESGTSNVLDSKIGGSQEIFLLQNWLNLLSRFRNNIPIPDYLEKRLIDHFMDNW